MNIKQLAHRCDVSEKCLPDSEYKNRLIELHKEMLDKIKELTFYRENHKCMGCWGDRNHCGCGEVDHE